MFITYNSPLPGSFPATVEIRFNGPVTVSGPRAISGSPEVARSCSQISESISAAVDVETITCGTLMTCALNPVGDTDSFRFSAPNGGTASIGVARSPSSAGTPCWRVFNPIGQPLTGFVCNNVAPVNLATAGTYTIEVVESRVDQPVNYTLSLQGVSQSFRCGMPIRFGDLKSSRLSREGDTDTFNFSAAAGEVVSISIARSAGLGTPCWRLFNPNGQALTGFVCIMSPPLVWRRPGPTPSRSSSRSSISPWTITSPYKR